MSKSLMEMEQKKIHINWESKYKGCILVKIQSFFLAKKSKRVTIVARNPMKTTKYHLQILKRDRTL